MEAISDHEHEWDVVGGSVLIGGHSFFAIVCHHCSSCLSSHELLDAYTTYSKMVGTAVAVLTEELDELRKEREQAAGELLVPLSEMPIGSTLAKVVGANRILRHRLSDTATRLVCLQEAVAAALCVTSAGPRELVDLLETALRSSKP